MGRWTVVRTIEERYEVEGEQLLTTKNAIAAAQGQGDPYQVLVIDEYALLNGHEKVDDDEDLQIEDGIPIPPPKNTRIMQKLLKLQVGQSFLQPNFKTRSFSGYRARLRPKEFTVQAVGTGIRIWRIK